MDAIIKKIEETSRYHFSKSEFKLRKMNLTTYVINGDYLTSAISNYRNEKQEVKVLKWFDDFWIYFEIKFIPLVKEFPKVFITLSVFQGESNDNIKSQLFRAEWDNFDDNTIHPQPHWHIYPVKYGPKIAEDFETYIDLNKEEGFIEFANPDNIKQIIDISKFHFAMNGAWIKENKHIHSIENDDSLLKWLSGILGHIREQLEYVV